MSLQALADPTRRQVFELLRHGPCAVGALAKQLPVSRPAASQHLKVLHTAGLVQPTKRGRHRLYHIDPRGLADLHDWLDSFLDRTRDSYATSLFATT